MIQRILHQMKLQVLGFQADLVQNCFLYQKNKQCEKPILTTHLNCKQCEKIKLKRKIMKRKYHNLEKYYLKWLRLK